MVLVCVMIWGVWGRTCGSEGVVIALDDLRAEIVQRVSDVEAVRVVEGRVLGGERRGVPAEGFGPDERGGAVVEGVAAVDEREAEVEVVLPVEDLPAEDEVAAVEAGEVLRGVDEGGVDEGGEEGQAGLGGGVGG